MVSPKYAPTHFFTSTVKSGTTPPHIVNLYLDYNCVFSAKLFKKFHEEVIPKVNQAAPDKFQFIFVNVIQPWHPPSPLIHEFSFQFAKLLREKKTPDSNKLFWNFSKVIFDNKENVWDSTLALKTRNESYEFFYDFISKSIDLPFSKEEILKGLTIATDSPANSGNDATNDIKYFTKYLRGVGVHVTPTVSVDGIVDPTVESSTEVNKLVEILQSHL